MEDTFQTLIDSEVAVAKATGDYSSVKAMFDAYDTLLNSGSGTIWKTFAVDPVMFKSISNFRDYLFNILENTNN